MSKYFIFIPNLLSIVRIGLVYPILNNIYLNNFQISIVFFVIAAIITPPDVISQFLLAIPLMILYEISILVGKFT